MDVVLFIYYFFVLFIYSFIIFKVKEERHEPTTHKAQAELSLDVFEVNIKSIRQSVQDWYQFDFTPLFQSLIFSSLFMFLWSWLLKKLNCAVRRAHLRPTYSIIYAFCCVGEIL